MADSVSLNGLEELQQAVAIGDMTRVREGLLALTDEERSVLEARLGTETVQRMYRRVRRGRRGAPLGRVVVLHGIMGSRLDAVGSGTDADRIWVNYFRLLSGRIEELRLTPDGQPADPRYRIRLGGLFPEYLPLLTELAERWEVLPVAYDWRHDLDRSADLLAAAITGWAGSRPVHVVAHSMGGLVARRFIQRHPEAWRAMADGDALASGGRLVMLGTPNRGSFAIPLVLTGQEKTVKMLEMLDVKHDMPALLRIIGTFAGLYQMLPAPDGAADDDRARLYEPGTWGGLPVHEALLERGRAIQRELDGVVDGARMLYVAGYDQRTPFRVRVEGPGRFSYQQTLDGDGRVPHELGLLDGVRTFWVRESHGDLPRNARVLEGIHDLLQRGATAALEDRQPARRGVAGDVARWQSGDEIEPIPAEVASAALRPVHRGTTDGGEPAEEQAARVEAWLVRDYLGTPGTRAPEGEEEARAPRRPRRRVTGALPGLQVEVWWADITRVAGDVHVVGHYENVLPQFAELALDAVVSGRSAPRSDYVLTNLTRRGILQGKLGNVEIFPWAAGEEPGRLVAVAGMGHPGTFQEPELRRLSRNVTWTVSSLPDAKTICMVLIGGGAGNLSTETALRGLVHGMIDGLGAVGRRVIERVRIVERELGRATRIHRCLKALAESPAVAGQIALGLDDEVRHGDGGNVGSEHCLALTLAAAASASAGRLTTPEARALDRLLASVTVPDGFRASAREAFAKVVGGDGRRDAIADLAATITVQIGDAEVRHGGRPARMSFVRDGDAIVIAALTDTAVVPERRNKADPALLAEAIAEAVDPDPERLQMLAESLHAFLVPADFESVLAREQSLVFEVDRAMAAVPWEMIASRLDEPDAPQALSLRAPVARQLRTAYSPPPGAARAARWPLRALVIGDPGDPEVGDSLPGARHEALEVARLLRARGVEVELMIGAPDAERDGLPRDVPPAKRWDVLYALSRGGFDLLHYAGHGDFDPKDPTRTGWVFKGGLLTAQELATMDMAPSLVVANACLSARTSDRLRSGRTPGAVRTEADLLPGLADEFFRRGVRNYVGTAWEVDDQGAVEFAREFYDTLLPTPGMPAAGEATVGAALLAARRALHAQEAKYGALWAAYQHYGDPDHEVIASSERATEGAGTGASGAATARDGRGDGDGTRDGTKSAIGNVRDGTKSAIGNVRGGAGKRPGKKGAAAAKPARKTTKQAARQAGKQAAKRGGARKAPAKRRTAGR